MILTLALSACRPRIEPRDVEETPARNKRQGIAQLAGHLENIPYRFGGRDVDGFDCSGLVWYVYSCYGIEIPRQAEEQALLEPKIDIEKAKAGDILLFKLESGWHSAIYLGGGFFVHAPKENERVRRETLSPYWRERLRHAISLF